MNRNKAINGVQACTDNFKRRKSLDTKLEIAVALMSAFGRGFDEGPHWSQVYSEGVFNDGRTLGSTDNVRKLPVLPEGYLGSQMEPPEIAC